MPWLIIRLRHLLCSCQSCPIPSRRFPIPALPSPPFPPPTSDFHFAQPTVHKVAVAPCPLSVSSLFSLSPFPAFHKPFLFCCPCLVLSLPLSSFLILSLPLSSLFSLFFFFFSLCSFSFLCYWQCPFSFLLVASPHLSLSLSLSPSHPLSLSVSLPSLCSILYPHASRWHRF